MSTASIIAIFAGCGLYLGFAGVMLLFRPGAIPLASAAPLLSGLETSGPYMFLIAGLTAWLVAWGLMRRINLARRAAIVAAVAGIATLVPPVSAAAVIVQPRSPV